MRRLPLAVLLLALLPRPGAAQTFSGLAFADLDADGLRGAGEDGIGSLAVKLFGDGIDVPVTSAPDGTFSLPFTAPCAGVPWWRSG